MVACLSLLGGTNNITLRKVNVNTYGFDKLHMDEDLMENKLFQIIDQFNEKKVFI